MYLAFKTFSITLAVFALITISSLWVAALVAEADADESRTIRLLSKPAIRGATLEVPVVLGSHGNEAALLLTIGYDPAVLSFPGGRLGIDLPDASSLTVNANTPGKLIVLVDWDNTLTAGDLHLLTVHFQVNADATAEETSIALEKCSLSDKNAEPLTVPLNHFLIPIQSAKISGRILMPDGRGLRNATVVLTGPDGTPRWVTTGSMGYFEFAEIAVGKEYNLQVRSKRFRFIPRSVVCDGTAVDLVGVG